MHNRAKYTNEPTWPCRGENQTEACHVIINTSRHRQSVQRWALKRTQSLTPSCKRSTHINAYDTDGPLNQTVIVKHQAAHIANQAISNPVHLQSGAARTPSQHTRLVVITIVPGHQLRPSPPTPDTLLPRWQIGGSVCAPPLSPPPTPCGGLLLAVVGVMQASELDGRVFGGGGRVGMSLVCLLLWGE